MNCTESRKLLQYYFENGKDPRDDKNLSMHLDGCAGCRQEMEFFEKYFSVLAEKHEIEIPDNFLAGVNRKIDRFSNQSLLSKAVCWGKGITEFVKKFSFPIEAAGVLATVMIFIVIFRPFEKTGMQLEKSIVSDEPAVTEEAFSSENEISGNIVVKTEAPENQFMKEAGNGSAGKNTAKTEIPARSDGNKVKTNISSDTVKKFSAEVEIKTDENVKISNKIEAEKTAAVKKSVSISGASSSMDRKSEQQKLAAAAESDKVTDDHQYEMIISEKSEDNSVSGSSVERQKQSVFKDEQRTVLNDSSGLKNALKEDSSDLLVPAKEKSVSSPVSVKSTRQLIEANNGKIVAESFSSRNGQTDAFLVEIAKKDYNNFLRQIQKTSNIEKQPLLNDENDDKVIKIWIKLRQN